MKNSKLRIFMMVFATAICLLDAFLIVSYRKHTAVHIGWLKIFAAGGVQILVFLVSTSWVAFKTSRKGRPENFEQNNSYRNYIPVVLLGFIIAGIGLSVSLLHIAIVCPNQGLPTMRGQLECAPLDPNTRGELLNANISEYAAYLVDEFTKKAVGIVKQ